MSTRVQLIVVAIQQDPGRPPPIPEILEDGYVLVHATSGGHPSINSDTGAELKFKAKISERIAVGDNIDVQYDWVSP